MKPALWLASLSLSFFASAETGPQPPCGGDPLPAFPNLDAEPAVRTWDHADWNPPACITWSASPLSTLVATAARFRNASGAEGLRRRIGAVSALTGLLYWSTTSKRWQALIVEAHAATAASSDQRRGDFSLDEITEGRTLYLHQGDNLLGKAVYRLRIIKASADHLVFSTDNSSAVQSLAIPLFRPGELESITFLEREPNPSSRNVWSYYSLVRMSGLGTTLLSGREASLINRAVALYRYMARIPADKEPPAAR